MPVQRRVAVACVAAVLALGARAGEVRAADGADDQFSLTTGVDYTVGNYGQSTKTTIVYIPVTAKYETNHWILGLTVPYLEVQGEGNVNRDIGVVKGPKFSRVQTQEGLGDVVAAATLKLLGSTEGSGLDLTGKIKFGTADPDKGLGTGRNDTYAQVDAYHTFDRLTPFVTLGRKYLRSPSDVQLRNVNYAALGASYKLSPERSVGAMWFGQERASDIGERQSEVTVFLNQKLNRQWKGQVYGLAGLAKGSPDYGFGAMATYLF